MLIYWIKELTFFFLSFFFSLFVEMTILDAPSEEAPWVLRGKGRNGTPNATVFFFFLFLGFLFFFFLHLFFSPFFSFFCLSLFFLFFLIAVFPLSFSLLKKK